jgi:beta-galactosidase
MEFKKSENLETVEYLERKPFQITLEPDNYILKATGEDLVFVTVKVVDKHGNLCENATNQLYFQVKGNGLFRAACNDALEMVYFPKMKLFNGKLVVLIQSTLASGAIQLVVYGDEIKSAEIHLMSEK